MSDTASESAPKTDLPRVLVTGAGGFIGSRTVEMLHFHPGFGVRGGIRRWSTAARIARFPVEIVQCDVMDRASIDRAMDGVSHVIHCARGGRRVNVEGTQNMLDAALSHGVRRFVHLSTIDVYGDATGPIDEDSPLVQTGQEYGDSKIGAEEACREAARRGLEVVILRPTIVYGPFSDLWTIEFAQRMQAGAWPFPDELCRGTCNLVYVDDVVQAEIRGLTTDGVSGHAFNVNGPERPTWREYFRALGRAIGIERLDTSSPARSRFKAALFAPIRKTARFALDHFEDRILALYQSSRLAKRVMKAAEGAIRKAPTAAEFDLYAKELDVSSEKAMSLLGYDPVFDMERGIARSVAWLEHHGYVRR